MPRLRGLQSSSENRFSEEMEDSEPEIKKEDVSPVPRQKQQRKIPNQRPYHSRSHGRSAQKHHSPQQRPQAMVRSNLMCTTYGKQAEAADLLCGLKGLYMHSEKLHWAEFKRKTFGPRTEANFFRFWQDEEFVDRRMIGEEEMDEIKKGNIPDDLEPRAAAKSRKHWPVAAVNEEVKIEDHIDTSDVMSRLTAVAESRVASSKRSLLLE
ncbi:hypothetical protein AC578_9488 [Pseudocercospora eumusae]|uniref:Uncharacterized protein n=1 Tax=Pseudocercospora eumusae TaxID=321146 RepID=A0A139GXS3_9PEZI|nr:hypothetical protein AC578_9488 [Pseudocercospora eumusae]